MAMSSEHKLRSLLRGKDLPGFWQNIIDPQGAGMAEAIAKDIASYTKETVGEVLIKMEKSQKDFNELWEKANVDVGDPRSVERFYRDQFVEAYELANWHCGREYGYLPLDYAWASMFAVDQGLKRVLDFGSGIGTGSLCLSAVGCEVHSADIAVKLLDFVNHRMRRHGYEPHTIDLNLQKPKAGSYDMIVCFDVLEHVPNQLAKLRELSTYLRIGGYLVVDLMEKSAHEDHLMHISSSGDWLSLVRRTCLKPGWTDALCPVDTTMKVLVRVRGGYLRNVLASWVDRSQAYLKARQ